MLNSFVDFNIIDCKDCNSGQLFKVDLVISISLIIGLGQYQVRSKCKLFQIGIIIV